MRNILLPSLLLATMLAVPLPTSYSSTTPMLSVTPETNSALPSESFTIALELGQVADLTSYDITLRYQGQVLTAMEVTLQPVNGKDFRLIGMLRDDGTGTVRVIAGLGGDTVSVPTAAQIFTIRFVVDELGVTPLEIANAKLSVLMNGVPTVIEPMITNGSFRTPPTPLPIDIKPGSTENPVNVKDQGVIPVALLTTPLFDASRVDVSSIRFGRTGVEAAPVGYPKGGALEDVDGDGDLDNVFHFSVQQTGIMAGDTQAKLTGLTILGVEFEGTDSIRAFFPGDVNGDFTVNVLDLALVGAAFMSTPGTRNWNSRADFDENGVINVLDLATLGNYFGQSA